MLPTKIPIIWKSCFRGEDFLEIDQSQARIVCGGHIGQMFVRNRFAKSPKTWQEPSMTGPI
jgi:hypothetical protein